MAATRFISMHKSKGKTPAVSLSERVAYILNPTKTDGGRLVSAHGCDPATAAAEMLLTRRQYLDAGLLAEKKKAYAEYAAAKKEMQAVLTAKANVDRLLGAPPERPEQEKEQAQR